MRLLGRLRLRHHECSDHVCLNSVFDAWIWGRGFAEKFRLDQLYVALLTSLANDLGCRRPRVRDPDASTDEGDDADVHVGPVNHA